MNETDFELTPEYEFDYAKAKPNRFANSDDGLTNDYELGQIVNAY